MNKFLKSTILTISAFSLTGCGVIDKVKSWFGGKEKTKETQISIDEFKKIGSDLEETTSSRLESLKEITMERVIEIEGKDTERISSTVAGDNFNSFELKNPEKYENPSGEYLGIMFSITFGSLPFIANPGEGITTDIPEDVKYYKISNGTYMLKDDDMHIIWDKYGLPIETYAEGLDEETNLFTKETAYFTYKI